LLSPSERGHLFALGGHSAPRRAQRGGQVSPAMRRIVERLSDTPAMVFSRFGEVLVPARPPVALFGDYTRFFTAVPGSRGDEIPAAVGRLTPYGCCFEFEACYGSQVLRKRSTWQGRGEGSR
jgi:hypothetical protein